MQDQQLTACQEGQEPPRALDFLCMWIAWYDWLAYVTRQTETRCIFVRKRNNWNEQGIDMVAMFAKASNLGMIDD